MQWGQFVYNDVAHTVTSHMCKYAIVVTALAVTQWRKKKKHLFFYLPYTDGLWSCLIGSS
jgi:hypothetical protein